MVARQKEKNVSVSFSEYQKRFLLEYFKEMRAEINLRINNHSSLVWAKVVTTGALMSFLLTQNIDPNIKIGGLAFAPIIAILYDIMIAKNLKEIHKIGHFIRDQIENVVFTDLELWENYSGQSSIQDRNYDSVDIFMLSAFTLGTMLTTVYLLWTQGQSKLAVTIFVVSLVVFIFLYRFMNGSILYFHKK
jgi:hypothetical protein